MENIAPYQNPYLIGHETAEQVFLNAFKSNALHHAWLISGPEGIGKATLAYKIARFLLANHQDNLSDFKSLDVDENSAAFRLIARRAHPNLKVLERDFIETDKKKVLKAIKDGEPLDEDDLQNLKKSAVIKVDETRSVHEFLGKKSFDGDWRVVLIDSADDLNASSANAILKILEEPPLKTILLLISHNPNRLLPTIRSRCAKLILQPLTNENVALLLHRYCPELPQADVDGIVQIAHGSIGRALSYVEGNALQVYQNLLKVVSKKGMTSQALQLAYEASSDEERWALTTEMFLKIVSNYIQQGCCVEKTGAVWDQAQAMFRDTENLNMDKRQVLLNLTYALSQAVSDAN